MKQISFFLAWSFILGCKPFNNNKWVAYLMGSAFTECAENKKDEKIGRCRTEEALHDFRKGIRCHRCDRTKER
jgi:hypothetical protein